MEPVQFEGKEERGWDDLFKENKNNKNKTTKPKKPPEDPCYLQSRAWG